MTTTGQHGLVRGLGPAAAASINIANMIGTGVFLKARVMTCNVGSPWAVLGVWAAAAALVLAGALTYAELAARMPRAGGEYVFLRETYGRRWGFLYGWTYLFVSRGGSLAAQAVSTAIFFNILTGGALEGGRLPLAAAAALGLMTLVNFAPVSATGRIASALTAVKIATVGAVAFSAFFLARGDWSHFALSNVTGGCEGVEPGARGGIAGFGAAMLGALWGFQGWANLTPLSGEVIDPRRNLPRAFCAAVLIVAALYLLANAGYFYALSPGEVAGVSAASSVATEVLRRFLGPAAAALMAAAMMTSSLGALHSGIAATARVPYAMAEDGLFFSAMKRLSPRSRIPARAAVAAGVWAALLTLTGSYDKLTDWAIFGLWMFYGLTAASLLVLRRGRRDAAGSYRVPGYPAIPLVFVAVTAWLLLNTLYTAPRQTALGLGLIALGLPFYAWWSRPRPS
jgi:APA family basic amino acid/polyamine antiporter